MNVKKNLVRFILVLFLLTASLCLIGTPAYALPPDSLPEATSKPCKRPRCGPQSLSNGTLAINDSLKVKAAFEDSELFVTDVDGASAKSEDIRKLVDDAITVWRAAFKEIPEDIELGVGWADFGVLKASKSEFLTDNLVGGVQQDCNEDNEQDLALPVLTQLPSVPGDVIGIHICGSDDENLKIAEEKLPCKGSKKATILFNSELLKVQERGKEATNVKLFLDTKPFQSSAFGSLETVGSSENRIKRSFEFSDRYVVDLFTVALHEVGHVLGYSEGNGIPSGHLGTLAVPDVLSPYVPFSTRKCPSIDDVAGLISAGPPISTASSAKYELNSYDPCGSIDNKPFDWIRFILLLLLAIVIGLVTFFSRRTQKQIGREDIYEEKTAADENE